MLTWGIKPQTMISIWICPLPGQCFTQDKGEEDFQGGYGYGQSLVQLTANLASQGYKSLL